MSEVSLLRCSVCAGEYEPDAVQYFCPRCGQLGTLEVLYDFDALRRVVDRDRLAASHEASMWRYKPLLPIGAQARVPPLAVGWTPLYNTERVAQGLGMKTVWIKDDSRNPTGSLKDRASALVVARAMQEGFQVVSTASTGNAAAALAGMCAASGVDCVIFVPATAPEAKIAQLLVYGAQVLLIAANYDTAFDLCYQMCIEEGWYCRNTGLNPYTVEGKKTVAYEIAEQLGWQVPDAVIVSVGDGNIISGVYKGFQDLKQLGWIERIPRLIGVQAVGSAALADAWTRGFDAKDIQPVNAITIADSISVDLPRDRAKGLKAVRETGGAYVTVSDDDIRQGILHLARLSGIFAEPAAAASFAGAQRAVQSKLLKPDETAALIVTGSGLKDIRRAQEAAGQGLRLPPDLAVIRQALRSQEKK